MPFPLIVIAGLIGVAAVVAVSTWETILGWAEKSLFPWVAKNMPSLESPVRKAFAFLDKATTAVRRAAKKAWAELRVFLLKQVVSIQKNTKNETVRQVTTWMIKKLQSGEEKPVKVVTEQEVDWDQLPDDVREALLRRREQKPVDVVAARERELLEYETAS